MNRLWITRRLGGALGMALSLSLSLGMHGSSADVTAAARPAAVAADARRALATLRGFRAMAGDAVRAAGLGDLPAARRQLERLKDSWDAAAPALRPRASGDWRRLDRSIDDALDALRSRRPDPAACWPPLSALLLAFYAVESTQETALIPSRLLPSTLQAAPLDAGPGSGT